MSEPPALPGVTHEWIDAGGLRTHVALAGPADAPPLFCVHGWPQHWWAWRHVIGEFSDRYRIICPDLRGHGWTEAPRDGYEKEQLATDLLALIDAMGLQKVTWAGHDWGAWVGMLAALRAPERFERLFVMAVPHLWAPRNDPRRLALLAYQVPISLPLLGPLAARRLPRMMLRAGRARGKFTPEELDTYTAELQKERPHVTVAVYRTLLVRELRGVIGGRYAKQKLEVPTTVLAGGKDLATGALPPGPVEGQPQLTVEVIDGAGHWLLDEAPEAVAAALGR